MSGRRTEPPSPRRLREARRRGEIATSRLLTGAVALAAGLAALAATGRSSTAVLARELRRALAGSAVELVEPWRAILGALSLLARLSLPPCAAAAGAALLAGALQARGLFAPEAIHFRTARLALGPGLRRIVSGEGAARAALGALQTAGALGLGWQHLRGAAPALMASPRLAPGAALTLGARTAFELALELAALLLALGALDLALSARRHRRALLMTREEVARDRREEDGDPSLRGERRRLHRSLSSASPVSAATCLVVNPTHVAVALHHDRASAEAPTVLAKGLGAEAARLRAEARRAGIPIVRDIALARALHRLADVGESIPEELYEAAAAVLVHVHGTSLGDLP